MKANGASKVVGQPVHRRAFGVFVVVLLLSGGCRSFDGSVPEASSSEPGTSQMGSSSWGPILFTGTGDQEIDVDIPNGEMAIVTVKYSGADTLWVSLLTADGISSGHSANYESTYLTSSLVNAPLADDRTTDVAEPITGLSVQAAGEWELEIRPATSALRIDSHLRSSGSKVIALDGGLGRFVKFTYTGPTVDSWFIVLEVAGGTARRLVDAKQDISETFELADGDSILGISAYEGDWSLQV